MTFTHLVSVSHEGPHGLAAWQASHLKFMSKPERVQGRSVMVDLCDFDLDNAESFGPFVWIDAALYAEHAMNLPTLAEASAFLRDIEAREVPGAVPKNDWTGVLAPLQFQTL